MPIADCRLPIADCPFPVPCSLVLMLNVNGVRLLNSAKWRMPIESKKDKFIIQPLKNQ
ncbi:MAG: hypothetical protein RIE73_30100 [Coleofasciculus sp. C1-SOL-03]